MASKEFGLKLKEFRKKAGLTQQKVADQLNIPSKATVSSWEIGHSTPDAETMIKLLLLYHVDDYRNLIPNHEYPAEFSQKERAVIYAYRAHPELHDAIKRMLEIQ